MATGFTVWVTGPEEREVVGVAEGIDRLLRARKMATERLDALTPGIDALGGEDGVCFVAGTLARHGITTVVAPPGASRAARDRARAQLGRMIEVYVHPAAASPAPGYEPPERPEVEVVTPEPRPGAGAERTLHTLEALGMLAPDENRAYTEDEEREVIRRLKAFGYL